MLQIRKLETLHVTATEGETAEQIKDELERYLEYEVVGLPRLININDTLPIYQAAMPPNTYTVKVVRRVEP